MPGGACAGGELPFTGAALAAVLAVCRWYWGAGLYGLALRRSGALLERSPDVLTTAVAGFPLLGFLAALWLLSRLLPIVACTLGTCCDTLASMPRWAS